MTLRGWQECDLIEFVANWEKDVIQSKWNKQYDKLTKKEKTIVLHPDFHNKEHTKILLRLAKKDGILKNFILENQYEFYKKILNQEEFLELKWCGKNPKLSIDEIDTITNHTRTLIDILNFLREYGTQIGNHEYTKKNIILAVKPLYNANHLYISQGYIIDGNHRAAANMMSIYEKKKYFPMLCYKVVRKR